MVAALLIVGRLVPAAKRERHNDVVGFVYAVVGVIYAVILAMVVIAAWGSLEDAKTNTYTETNALLQLDWYGHSLPQPQHAEVQGLVKEYTEIVIHDEWPLLARHQTSSKAWAVFTQLRDFISAQQPTTPADVIRYQQALYRGGMVPCQHRDVLATGRLRVTVGGHPGLSAEFELARC